jgi:PHP family Zn ribbon phosphoesterase
LGREANVFELPEVTYREVIDAIRREDSDRFLMTIETDPCYGKYHYTGHRNCNVSLGPSESRKYGNICPVCKKKLTVGVLDRVVELADRAEGYRPEGAIPYVSLIPLQEVISNVLGIREVFAKSVWEEYNKLIKRFPNEFHVLLQASRRDISSASSERIGDAIMRVREGRIKFRPGYDGLYGEPIILEDNTVQVEHGRPFNEEKKEETRKNETEFNEKPKPRNQRSLCDYL